MENTLTRIDEFIGALEAAVADGSLVRVALRQPAKGAEGPASLDIRPVLLGDEVKLAFTEHHKTRDLAHNHGLSDGLDLVRRALGGGFRQGFLFTTAFDMSLDLQGKSPRLRRTAPSSRDAATLEHDRRKTRPIPAGKAYLTALGVTDERGAVLKTAGDKFRQINRYVEILAPLLKGLPPERLQRVVDMGAGKGYLTFAVADYLAGTLGIPAEVIGVERRPELVASGNQIARASGVSNLRFESGDIENYDSSGANVLIALHACDTATDDAIAKGIAAEAELIVVAPCCHKQIRREIEQFGGAPALNFLLRHGIFVERQAEMVTDGIRALVLEYFGYSTKVFEFVSDVHTPKNVLIVGTRTKQGRNPAALQKIADAKSFFGIRRHYLEGITELPASAPA